jgi:hypothetical protein
MFGAVIVDGPQTEGLDFGAELQLITGAKIPTGGRQTSVLDQRSVKVGVGNFGQSTDVVTNGL